MKRISIALFYTLFVLGLIGGIYGFFRAPLPIDPVAKVEQLLVDAQKYEFRVSRFEREIYASPPQFEALLAGRVSDSWICLLAMQCVADKMLTLDDSLSLYFDEFGEQDAVIKIRHLMNHTSGITPNAAFAAPTLFDAAFRPLAFDPGSEVLNCSTNIELLIAVIEKVSHEPISRRIERDLFEPLSMTATRWQDDGTCTTSIDDLAKWTASMNSNRVLPLRAMLELLTPPKLVSTGYGDYAGGWLIEEAQGLRCELAISRASDQQIALIRFPEKTWTAVLVVQGSQIDITQLGLDVGLAYLEREVRGASRLKRKD